ncbi:MAG: acyltransferase [Candidatus Dormibacteraeota bacterium]|nr:acyltransferase [Candidatus Dormibacteraeota bacterium]
MTADAPASPAAPALEPRVSQAGEPRSARVESLRALAALSVLVAHIYGNSLIPGDSGTGNIIGKALLGGGFGVYLFFALSGYLLYRPFVRHFFGGGDPIDLRRYALNRALRILPLYYAVSIVVILTVGHGGSPTLWLKFALFAQNYFPSSFLALDSPMWSLVVELHFYLLLPVMAYVLWRLSRGSVRTAMLLLVVLGLVSGAGRFAAIVLTQPANEFMRYASPTNFIFFVPGLLLAHLDVSWRTARPAWLVGLRGHSSVWLVPAAVAWAVVLSNYSLEALLLVASFFTVGACVLPLTAGMPVRLLRWRPLAILGLASYSLYLWQFPIVVQMSHGMDLPQGFLAHLAIVAPVCIVVALISYRLIEAPWLSLRKRWSPSSPAPAATYGKALARS